MWPLRCTVTGQCKWTLISPGKDQSHTDQLLVHCSPCFHAHWYIQSNSWRLSCMLFCILKKYIWDSPVRTKSRNTDGFMSRKCYQAPFHTSYLISGHQVGLQGLTVRGGVRLGRTSRRTCLWWGCRWGTRTSRTSRGRCRRERPEPRTDPGRSAGRRRFGLAFGTYRNGRSWWVKKTTKKQQWHHYFPQGTVIVSHQTS